jgi:hypothetical protein
MHAYAGRKCGLRYVRDVTNTTGEFVILVIVTDFYLPKSFPQDLHILCRKMFSLLTLL